MLLEVPLDAVSEGHQTARAPHTGPVETDADAARLGDIDEFEVPTVSLHARADGIENTEHPAAEAVGRRGGSG